MVIHFSPGPFNSSGSRSANSACIICREPSAAFCCNSVASLIMQSAWANSFSFAKTSNAIFLSFGRPSENFTHSVSTKLLSSVVYTFTVFFGPTVLKKLQPDKNKIRQAQAKNKIFLFITFFLFVFLWTYENAPL